MPKTLLLADDSVTIQKVVGISFANEDVELVTVDNGDDALARAREVRPDIVLADVVMPGMNGYEVCEAIKADPALRHVPVLLLTGTFEAYDEERAQRVGADGHVTKPFEAQALVDLVSARLAEVAAQPAGAAAPSAAGAAPGGDADLLDEVTAPSATAPGGEAADPAARTQVLGAAEPAASDPRAAFDFGAEEAAEAAAFEMAPGGTGAEPDPGPLQATGAGAAPGDATSALFDDDEAFANAETLPPVDAELPSAAAPSAAEAPRAPVESGAPPAPVGSGAPPAAPVGSEGPPAAPMEGGAPPPGDAPDPFEATRVVQEPFAGADSTDFAFAPTELEPGAAEAEDDLAGPGAGEAFSARDFDVSTSDLDEAFAEGAAAEAFAAESAPGAGRDEPGEALASPAPQPEPEAEAAPGAEPAPLSAPAASAPQAAPSAEAAPRPPELSPAFRQEIRDTLEKVAWEAFGEMADKLVKDALDRVERVAWEVVPQMAETLIQEEIRRLKGEED